MLDADRQTHHVGQHTGVQLLLRAQLAVRGGRRVDYQRAGVADVGQVVLLLGITACEVEVTHDRSRCDTWPHAVELPIRRYCEFDARGAVTT